jgi:hypothetical protein
MSSEVPPTLSSLICRCHPRRHDRKRHTSRNGIPSHHRSSRSSNTRDKRCPRNANGSLSNILSNIQLKQSKFPNLHVEENLYDAVRQAVKISKYNEQNRRKEKTTRNPSSYTLLEKIRQSDKYSESNLENGHSTEFGVESPELGGESPGSPQKGRPQHPSPFPEVYKLIHTSPAFRTKRGRIRPVVMTYAIKGQGNRRVRLTRYWRKGDAALDIPRISIGKVRKAFGRQMGEKQREKIAQFEENLRMAERERSAAFFNDI